MPGATAFAGGVSDSLYGASAFELNFDSVTAKKAWFFFDKEVVCLGAASVAKQRKRSPLPLINAGSTGALQSRRVQ